MGLRAGLDVVQKRKAVLLLAGFLFLFSLFWLLSFVLAAQHTHPCPRRAIPAGERPQTYAPKSTATGIRTPDRPGLSLVVTPTELPRAFKKAVIKFMVAYF